MFLFSSSAVLESSPEDVKAADLIRKMDKINEDLDRTEKEILNRMRTPLDNRNPIQDLANKQQEHEVHVTRDTL